MSRLVTWLVQVGVALVCQRATRLQGQGLTRRSHRRPRTVQSAWTQYTPGDGRQEAIILEIR